MTTTTMNTAAALRIVYVPASIVGRSEYKRRVVEHGHVPGVLSGAELKGNAKKWSGSYARQRAEVEALVAAHNIKPGIVEGKRVWTDATTGEPVELYIA